MFYDLKINSNFLYTNAPKIKWSELQYGYQNNYIDIENIIKFVTLNLNDNSNEYEYELSMLNANEKDRFNELIEYFVEKNEKIDINIWIYLLLKWFYEIDISKSDKFCIVKILYEKFNRPENLKRLLLTINSQTTSEEKLNEWKNVIKIYKTFSD